MSMFIFINYSKYLNQIFSFIYKRKNININIIVSSRIRTHNRFDTDWSTALPIKAIDTNY